MCNLKLVEIGTVRILLPPQENGPIYFHGSSCSTLVCDASYIHLEASPLIHVCVNSCY